MSIRRTLALVLAGPLLMAGTACSDDLTAPQATQVSVVMIDAPGNVEHLWVEFSRGFLVEAGGDEVDLFTTLRGPIDIASLVDGQSATLVTALNTPSGSYLHLLLALEGAVLETEGGEVLTFGGMEHPEGTPATGSLECTGCEDGVVRTTIPRQGGTGITLGGGAVVLVLDFDINQSVTPPPPGGGDWTLDPVIPVSSANQSFLLVGEVTLVQGVTIPECPAGTPRDITSFVPTATSVSFNDDDGVDLLRTGRTDAQGNLEIAFLQEDSYDLGHVNPIVMSQDWEMFFEAAPTPERIVPAPRQQQLEADYTITSATCEPRS